MKRANAIQALIGGFITVDNKGNVTSDDGRTLPSDADIDTKFAEMIAEETANQYKEVREMNYSSIGDQLDLLFHDMTAGKGTKSGEWYKAIAKVKADNPKG